jgi:hypothetical protein
VLLSSVGHHPSYARALEALAADAVPFLVGGALALGAYCGIQRDTKDLDVFVTAADLHRALGALGHAGFRTEVTYPHWLAKAYADERHFVDVIFNSGNGGAPVDAEWFTNAREAIVFGVPVGLCPVEETIWSKAFVMERERFDGADIAHLLLACAETLDWDRLVRRFGPHWPVLLAHLVLFAFAFPDDAGSIPRSVMDELVGRLRREGADAPTGQAGERPRMTSVCNGTLLSREQYLPDMAHGWRDARLAPSGGMTADAVARWTEAIRLLS